MNSLVPVVGRATGLDTDGVRSQSSDAQNYKLKIQFSRPKKREKN